MHHVRRRLHGTLPCALAVTAVGLICLDASALGHWPEDRYSNLGPGSYGTTAQPDLYRDAEVAPADLPAPRSMPMANKGSFISPRWILGAWHQSSDVLPNGSEIKVLIPKTAIPGYAGEAGYFRYGFQADETIRDQSTRALDLHPMRLHAVPSSKESSAPDINLDTLGHDFFTMQVRSGFKSVVTLGGLGNTFHGDDVSTSPEPSEGLRWGRQLTTGGAIEKFDNVSIDAIGSVNYVPYEAKHGSGDSGSGFYHLDGSGWSIAGVAGTPVSVFSQVDIDVVRSAIQLEDASAVVEIDGYVPSLLQASATWVNSSSSWDSSLQWTSGVPQLDEVITAGAVASNAEIASLFGPSIATGVDARTGNLTIGRQTTATSALSAADVTVSGGTLTAWNAYIAPRSGGYGILGHSAGSIDVTYMQVGGEGRAVVNHSGGSSTITGLLSVGSDVASSGSAAYNMSGTSSLSATEINVGGVAGSQGALAVVGANTSVESRKVIVGVDGSGTLDLQDTTLTVNGALVLGEKAGGSGVVAMLGSTSVVSQITAAGVEGTATVYQADTATHATGELSVAPGSFYLFDGGELRAASIAGHVTFGEYVAGSGNLIVSEVVDYTAATFGYGAVGGGGFDVLPGGLMLVAGAPSVSVVNTGGAVHVVGQDFNLESKTVQGAGAIPDHVVVGAGGELVASPSSLSGASMLSVPSLGVHSGGVVRSASGGEMFVQGSVDVTGDAVFSSEGTTTHALGVGGTFRVHTGATADFFGQLVAQSLDLDIQVDSGATLSFDGVVASSRVPANLRAATIAVDGEFLIGSNSSALGQFTQTDFDSSKSDFTLADGAVLGIDVGLIVGGAAYADNIVWDGTFSIVDAGATEDSVLSLSLLDGYVPDVGEQHDIVTATSISGAFDKIDGGVIDTPPPSDNEAGLGWAVQYAADRVSITAALLGDTDLDGDIDVTDLNEVQNNFGMAATWETGDFNGNGVVDLTDLNYVQNYFGFSRTSGSGGQGVPEPSSALLLLCAGVIACIRADGRPCLFWK